MSPAPQDSTAFAGWLASASEDDAVRVWKPNEKGAQAAPTPTTDFSLAASFRGHTDPALRVTWHTRAPDSGILASASGDRTAQVWQLKEGEGGGQWAAVPVASLGGHAEEVYACEFLSPPADASPSSLRLVTASGPGLEAWEVRPDGRATRLGASPACCVGADATTGAASTAPLPPRWAAAHVFGAAAQPATAPPTSRPLVAAACSDGALRLWACESSGRSGGAFTPLLGVRVHAGAVASSLAWAPDGRAVAVGASDGSLALIDIRKPSVAAWRGRVGAGSGPAYGCAFVEQGGSSSGGPPLLAVAAADAAVALFNTTAGPSSPLDWLQASRPAPHRFLCVAAGPGGSVVAAGDAVEGGGPGGVRVVGSAGEKRAVWTNEPPAAALPNPAHMPKRALWAPITVFEPRALTSA